jgi:adenosylcobinamide-phosphate synthase
MVTSEVIGCGLLVAASWLDYAVGDPWSWYHPVQAIGWVIRTYSNLAIDRLQHPLSLKLAGIFLCWGTIMGTGLISWGIVNLSNSVHPWFGLAMQVIMLASCLAARSLRQAAMDVIDAIDPHDLAPARTKLSLYVGRDTEKLTEPEIYRSILETVTENATDGVMAPLFYAILGMLLSIGCVPLAMAYKAASTLDSMVGYKRHPYTDLGWCSAKSEDILTWLPCRLVVLSIGLISGKPLTVWRLCWRDAPQDPSPNSGWSECAYAAALGVQVGGTNYYRGQIQQKPLMGDAIHSITAETIDRALSLTRVCILLWVGLWVLGVGCWLN